jgi:hypothetical protein
MAIGLGLWRRATRHRLAQTMKDSSDQQLKGYIALSLGLMRTGSAASCCASNQAEGHRLAYRLNLARALGC